MISRISKLFGRDREVDCVEVRGTASDYIDGDLVPDAQEKVRAHLEWCGPCHSFVNTLRATIALLRSSERHAAPPSLVERLKATGRGADQR